MGNNQTTARLQISRLRVGTDGDGARTLVSFYGCPLDCRYCLNPHLRTDDGSGKLYTPQELFDEIIRDRYYLATTGGGITFGGGEPLLHPDFIKEFCLLAKDEDWNVYVETSLNVDGEALKKVAPYIREFIVDIKDLNPEIYTRYTGGDVSGVFANLQSLDEEYCSRYGTRVLVRIPLIPEYNTKEDVKKTKRMLKDSFWSFSLQGFKYVLPDEKRPEPNGKRICEILKTIRQGLINENGLDIKQPICTNKGNCPGTCPVCETELDRINALLGKDGRFTGTEIAMLEFDRDLHKRAGIVECGVGQLMGITLPPERLLGDMTIEKIDDEEFKDCIKKPGEDDE